VKSTIRLNSIVINYYLNFAPGVDEERTSGGETAFNPDRSSTRYCECLGKGRSTIGWDAIHRIQVQYLGIKKKIVKRTGKGRGVYYRLVFFGAFSSN